jgi:hypothetical protein
MLFLSQDASRGPYIKGRSNCYYRASCVVGGFRLVDQIIEGAGTMTSQIYSLLDQV